jgi:peptidoglycan DL-endopeptidase CwlO
MPLSRATLTWILAAGCAAALAGDLAAATPKQRIAEKQAQAKAVLAQVGELDRRFEASVESWNGARLQLAGTKRQLIAERKQLAAAERARQRAVALVRTRLVAIYESDDDDTALGILLGSTTLSGMIDRLDAAQEIAQSDRRLATAATRARDRYAQAAFRASALEQQQQATVDRLSSERKQIGSLLDERRSLLSSVQTEVATLQVAEARRQAALEAAAEARLAREAAERRAAQERANAAAAAAAKTRAATPAVAPATTVATTTTQVQATTTVAADPTPATTTTDVADPSPQSLGPGHPEAAQIALRYLGVKYVWGGASPDGFDCSGLVMYVYAQLGVALPHFAAAQYALGVAVPRDELQPGDLVFFDGLDHVGIYIGGGEMVHAPQTGDVVKITALSDFGNRYVGARRI